MSIKNLIIYLSQFNINNALNSLRWLYLNDYVNIDTCNYVENYIINKED